TRPPDPRTNPPPPPASQNPDTPPPPPQTTSHSTHYPDHQHVVGKWGLRRSLGKRFEFEGNVYAGWETSLSSSFEHNDITTGIQLRLGFH
ncbi:MAG: hypothetical protein AAGC85_12320, partial [Bacteroidota bacterium]